MKKKRISLIVFLITLVVATFGCSSNSNKSAKKEVGQTTGNNSMPKVYFTKEITPEALMKVYKALGREAKGNNVAIKVSTGEPGGKNFLKPTLIGDLVKSVNGTIIECNRLWRQTLKHRRSFESSP